MPSQRKKLVWCAVAFFAAPLIAETAVRIRNHVRWGSTHDVFDVYRRDPQTGLREPIPNLEMTLARRSTIRIDSRGFRNPEITDPKPKGTLRLAFLGASPVFCVEVPTNADTWPQRVCDRLTQAHPSLRFEPINAAVSAYGLDDSRRRFARAVAPLRPDVVLVYHATRDLTVDAYEQAVAAGLEEPAAESWLERHSALWAAVSQNLRYLSDQRRGRGIEAKLAIDPDASAAKFETAYRALLAEVRRSGALPVVVPFAIRARRDQPREVQLENLAHAFTFTPFLTPESIFSMYEAYNAAATAAARAEQAVVLQGAAALPGDAVHFCDSVHLTAEGCAALGRLVAAELLASPPFQQRLAAAAGGR